MSPANGVLEHFIQHVAKVRTLGAVTIMVFARVTQRLHRSRKHISGFLDLGANFWQITDLKRRTVFFNQMNKGDSIKNQVAVLNVESFLGEVERLVDELKISVGHRPFELE